jgi:hypothetical protein
MPARLPVHLRLTHEAGGHVEFELLLHKVTGANDPQRPQI